MILIDSDIFIDHFRNYAPATRLFESLKGEEVIFSAITETEIVAGQQCSLPDKKSAVLQFLHQWKKSEVTNAVAVLAGDLVRTFGIPLADSVLAATALLHGATVYTKNTKDFRRVKDLKVKVPY